jgi:chloramphenicol-sensitive protein RarD
MNRGIAYAALAYAAWGLFPLYFRQLAGVGAFEIVLHRVAWSLLFLVALLLWLRRWQWLAALRQQPRVLGACAVSALLLSCNWLIYVWAVMNGRVLDASLGYFINPLVNVLLGFFVLHERPRVGQWLAVALAGCGVLWLAVLGPQVPWVGLTIAVSFGLYLSLIHI